MTNSSWKKKDSWHSQQCVEKLLIEVLGNNTDQCGDIEDRENLCGEQDQNLELGPVVQMVDNASSLCQRSLRICISTIHIHKVKQKSQSTIIISISLNTKFSLIDICWMVIYMYVVDSAIQRLRT